MILPNKFYNADYAASLRGMIGIHVGHIVDFGYQQVFENATTYTNLLFLNKSYNNNFEYIRIDKLKNNEEDLGEVQTQRSDTCRKGQIQNETLGREAWNFVVGEKQAAFQKLQNVKTLLGDVAEKILVGLQTSADPIYILEFRKENKKTLTLFSKELKEELEIKKEILKPLLKGKEIKRYSTPDIFYWLIFPYSVEGDRAIHFSKDKLRKEYPKAYSYFESNKAELQRREGGKWRISRLSEILCK